MTSERGKIRLTFVTQYLGSLSQPRYDAILLKLLLIMYVILKIYPKSMIAIQNIIQNIRTVENIREKRKLARQNLC